MIQIFAGSNRLKAPRSAAALMLAFILNVALVPCAMAIEAIADEHDCCPPELRLEAADCCEPTDGIVPSRNSTVEFDDGDPISPAPDYTALAPVVAGRSAPPADPPDPPDCRPDLNALYCVYLK